VSFIINNFHTLFLIFCIFIGLAISHRSLARGLQKKRKMTFGDEKLPTSWDDMQNVPEQFKTTHSAEAFLIMNQSINNKGALIMGFSSPSLLEVLRKSEELSIDGTFDITKWTLFAQVKFIILDTFFYYWKS
jgi:hypothetical protein